jgi:hypothetical protein
MGDLSIPDMHVTAVTNTAWPFPGAVFDGILGLGFQAIAQPSRATTPFMYRLKELGVDGIFTFIMPSNGGDGTFIVGSVQNHLYNAFGVSWLPVTVSPSVGNQLAFWMVDYGGMNVGSQTFGSGRAIVDSGTSCILMPPGPFAHFQELIGSRQNCDGIGWPDIEITLGGRGYLITPLDYAIAAGREKSSKTPLCAPCVQSGNDELILGDVFHRKFVVTYDFDNKRIGVPISSWWDAYWPVILLPSSTAAFFLLLYLGFWCTHRNRNVPSAREPLARFG